MPRPVGRAGVRVASRRRHYWLLTADENLRPYLIYGSPSSESEAREKGIAVLQGLDFEIRALPTRNLAAASAMVRGKRLEETHSLKKARQRQGHQKSLDRLQRRRQRRQTKYSVGQV